MSEEKLEETKKNIEYWENEVQIALKEKDIMKAVGCRICKRQQIYLMKN